eukprot:6214143-Pleurochrysis_carterae.AAC.2
MTEVVSACVVQPTKVVEFSGTGLERCAMSLMAPATSAPLRRELGGSALRQALSSAARASDLNVVGHPSQTEADTRRTRLREDAESYIQQNLNTTLHLAVRDTPSR